MIHSAYVTVFEDQKEHRPKECWVQFFKRQDMLGEKNYPIKKNQMSFEIEAWMGKADNVRLMYRNNRYAHGWLPMRFSVADRINLDIERM